MTPKTQQAYHEAEGESAQGSAQKPLRAVLAERPENRKGDRVRSREECYKGWTEALRETREALDKVSLPLDRERLADQLEQGEQ